MPVSSMERAETFFQTFDVQRRQHKYIVEATGMTDETLYDWLLNAQAGLAALNVERPDGTTAADGETPLLLAYDGRFITNVSVKHVRDCDPEIFEVVATYEPETFGAAVIEPKPTGDAGVEFGFEIGPDNEVIKSSLETVQMWGKNSGPSPDQIPSFLNRAINLQDDGTVEGVQIPDSSQVITYAFTDSPTWFTASRIATISRARGTVNSADFTTNGLTFSAGEVRFLGATGRINSSGNSTIDFRFGIRQNQVNVTIPGIRSDLYYDEASFDVTPAQTRDPVTETPDSPLGIKKDGWDYLWVYYGRGVDAQGKPTSVLRQANVERILRRTDLNDIFA